MKLIGITGGIGAGKSEILQYLATRYHATIVLADEVAHRLMEPGTECYIELKKAFPMKELYEKDGSFCRSMLAELIFSDEKRRTQLNAIVHPAVKQEILKQAASARKKAETEYFIIEAALLIQDGYDTLCDELWYIETKEQIRRERLKQSRGYSDEKIDAVFLSQLPDNVYRKYCRAVIDNNGTIENTFRQIDQEMIRLG